MGFFAVVVSVGVCCLEPYFGNVAHDGTTEFL